MNKTIHIFFFAPSATGLGASVRRAAMMLLMMLLTTVTAWAGTVDVTVNVSGSGSVSIGNQTATAGNPFTTSVDDGASVTLTFAPDAGNIVTSAKLSYKPSEDGTAVDDIAISGSTATFQMPNDIWNGTGVTINVTFGAGLVGGADEASAVALTDATVSNLAGGYYKVESDISFDHTLNLIGDTYLVIASGAKMTVSSSEFGINGELYALNVLGEGTLNVTTTGSNKIAVSVSSYTQSGCSVNLTTTYIGMRCSGSFNISGGSFTTNGSYGIWPNKSVNISGGKLEASNINANINLSYSSTDDYIKVDTYTNGKTMTIANGQTFTDGATNYSGTIENLSALNGKKLFPFAYTHLTVRDATCTEVGIKQECWQRSSDGKYFSDENGTTELSASDVETPMIPHTGVHHDATDTHIEYWQCYVCSKYFSNSGCTTEITEEDTKIYRTITIADGISSLVTSNVDKAVAGTTVTLTVSYLIDASTLRVNDGSVALTDAGNGTYTFTVPAADVTVTASTATTYSVNLPANMEIVSATTTADGDGKYISGTVVTFKASFSYTASNVSDGANTLTADGSGNYSVTIGTADITVTATIEHSSNIDLSQAPGDFTVVDGDILTAATSHTVTIAENAKITLSNATISGGIVCAGSAEITLVGTNNVSNTRYSSAGIQIGSSGTTLTIKGNGSLNATGGSASAGIGLGRTWDANATGGSVVIEGGAVTASGGNGIGIGTVGNGKTAHMDGIIIKGGTVNARLGKGYIYNGSTATIGTLKIYDGIEKVDASAITESVTYMHVDGNTETDVTANKTEYFTIIENGNRRIIVQKVTPTIADVPEQTYTGSAITPEPLVMAGSLSLTKGTDYTYSYENNTDVGTAKVRATFQGTYASLGSVEKEFTILPSTVKVSVTGSGTVTCGDRSATGGNSFGVMSEKGANVTLTLAPTDGNAVRSVEYGYTNNSGTTASGLKLPISGTTATLTVPDNLKDGTGVTVTVTFAPALNGGADEASAVALTDATVTDLGGGWYKVENDISFDHTLNLLADTYLTIAKGKTMTVNTASGEAIDSEYTLNVSGEGALNITTTETEAYKIAVRVGSYVQTGATVTANGYIGIRCTDNFDEFNVTNDFTFSGGQLTATGSGGDGIDADNDIILSCSNATDFIKASSYISTHGAVKIAEGKALTDGTEASNGMNGYSGTLTDEQTTAIGGKTLHRAVTTSYVEADGTLHENVIAIPLDNTMTTLGSGWYVVNENVDYTGQITLGGDVNIILADGKTMSASGNSHGIYGDGPLTIYGQALGTGILNVTSTSDVGIRVVDGVTINGGTVNTPGICSDGNVTINGGKVTNNSDPGICSNSGTIILGLRNATDYITAESYSAYLGIIVKAGQTLVDDGGNIYTGTLTSKQITAIAGQTLRPVMGVVLTKDGSGNISAEFDGTSLETVSIPVNITVNSVTLNRTFTYNKCATLMLPFSLSEGQTLNGGTLYKFDGVENGTTGDWLATLSEFTSPLKANTPYLIQPNGHITDDKITFNLNGGTVTLNTTTAGEDSNEKDDLWDFIGTYQYIKWTTDTGDQDYSAEREAEIGKVYGFAAVEKTGIHVGDFVRVASGAKIRPMCAYLKWKGSIPNNARALTRAATNDDTELPQRITVKLVSASGETTAIGTLDTTTGEVSFDSEAWYTLDGVRLSGKPTKKGLYINNGKKIVIR